MRIQFSQRRIADLAAKGKPYEVRDNEVPGLWVRIQPTGSKTYYYRYRTLNGHRKRIKLGNTQWLTVEVARQQAIQHAALVLAGMDPVSVKIANKQAACRALKSTLGAFLEAEYTPWFLEHRKGGMKAIIQARRIFAFLLPVPLTDITPLVIDRWRSQKHQQGVKKETLNRYLSVLRSILNKATEWDYMDKNPLQYVRAYRVDANKHVERYLSAEEEMNLRYALDQREQQLREERRRYNEWNAQRGYRLYPDLTFCAFADHLTPLVLLAMNTGMRKRELLTLTWHNINFDHRSLTVRGEISKSGQTRHIPLNEEGLSVLQRWKHQQTETYWVFPGKNGQPIQDIKTAWGSVLKRAGIDHFRFHDLRHHFASQLVMAGVDLNTIRELLGHRDYSSTLRYAHLAPTFLADAVAKLKPRYWDDCKPATIMR